VGLLFDCCVGKSAVVPRWPDHQIEPLQTVYCRELALEAAKEALANGEVDLGEAICRLHGVRYLSTLVVEQLDPDFRTFFRVKSALDLKKAAMMTKPKKNEKLKLKRI
jgi:molybdopterin-guanine dinucleotide biosynthesis protein A